MYKNQKLIAKLEKTVTIPRAVLFIVSIWLIVVNKQLIFINLSEQSDERFRMKLYNSRLFL